MPTGLNTTDTVGDLADDADARIRAESQRWSARVNLLGGLKKIYVNGHAITGTELNSASQLLPSISTSLSEQYAVNAAARGIRIDSLEIWATGKIDSLTPQAVSNRHSQSGGAEWRVYLKSDASSDAIQELHEYTMRTSPFRNILANRVNLTVEIISPNAWHEAAWCNPS